MRDRMRLLLHGLWLGFLRDGEKAHGGGMSGTWVLWRGPWSLPESRSKVGAGHLPLQ